jgi:hypothetical protein
VVAPIHGIVEALERSSARFLKCGPAGVEAEGEASEHGQHQRGGAGTHSAAVFVGRPIQPLMQTVFDGPIASCGLEELLDGQLRKGIACDQPNGFRHAMRTPHGGVQADLYRRSKADLFRRRLLSEEAAAFFPAAIDFLCVE